MNDGQFLQVKKPISLWNKPLKANFKDLFKSLTKASFSSMTLNWTEALKSATDAINAISFEDDAGQVAWLLIYRSIIRAVYILVEDHFDLIKSSPVAYWCMYDQKELPSDAVDAITEKLDLSLEQCDVTIDESFFRKPEDLSVLQEVKVPLTQWLNSFGLTDAQAKTVSNKLPRYFVASLTSEWHAHHDSYKCLKEAVNTPFTKANERESAWSRYTAWLNKQVEEPMFYEAFSLREVYVPLRAYYEQKLETTIWRTVDRSEGRTAKVRDTQRVIVDIEAELTLWLSSTDPLDTLRIISGGPGSGKSTFAKMFSARHAMKAERRVLLVPLHRFELTADLVDAIGNFVKYDRFIPHNPLDPKEGDSKILVIFDGLDELSMQGKASAEVATQFMEEVQRKLDRFNYQEIRLKILITGRELAIQAYSDNFRRQRQVLHLLPYFVPSGVAERYDPTKVTRLSSHDPNKLLMTDQRQLWWIAYGAATGQGYTSMPEELSQAMLVEITSQPLLNYLVALSFVRGKLDFKNAKNLNLIYADLLDAVYQRVWGANPHPATSGISENSFLRILEEISISTWQGESRTTTIKEIEDRCADSGLGPLLEMFKGGARDSIARLLIAFYFRKFGNRPGSNEESFEFTHKSFGEYLTAKRIVRSIRRMHEEMERRKTSYDSGWSERDALLHWVRLCGPVPINRYIFNFLLNEIALSGDSEKMDEIQNWQQSLTHLINVTLRQGIPMDGLSPRPSFKEETRQARNVGSGLLISLNACARITGIVSSVDWPSSAAFSNWISEIEGQRISDEVPFVCECLSLLGLSKQFLRGKFLAGANLQGVDLREADLQGVNLANANLNGANLQKANLKNADLRKANLSNANLQGANLLAAQLQETNCLDANFESAKLRGASFRNAGLTRANFQKANLQNADFQRANLQEANLQLASLKNATLQHAVLLSANLQTANLEEANLQYAQLQGASLQKAKLQKAHLAWTNLRGANCEEAHFQQSNLQDADLQKVNLSRAKLQGALLQRAKFQGAELQEAELQLAKLQLARLDGANLQRVKLHRANLLGAHLQEANFNGAELQGAMWVNGREIISGSIEKLVFK